METLYGNPRIFQIPTYIHSRSGTYTPSWRSLCHNQPNMENTAVFLDTETGEGPFGICRRCGKESELICINKIKD